MDALSLLVLSVGLAMDCLTVALAAGMKFRDIKIIQALKMAFFFGGFQTGMALLGWLAGAQVI